MVRVIKPEKTEGRRVTCYECNKLLEYYQRDVIGRSPFGGLRHVKCPNCKAKNAVPAWEVTT